MQTQLTIDRTQLPVPPPPPAAPVLAGGVLRRSTAVTGPVTKAEAQALYGRRSELSTQLNSAQGRRDALAHQLLYLPAGPARTGIEQHVTLLDTRILQIESDLDAVGQRLSSAPAIQSGTVEPGRYPGVRISSGQATALGIVFTIVVLAPMAMAYLVRMIRREPDSHPSVAPVDTANRLERIEQAVDAIAIEVERVAEGQRFTTRLLGEVHARSDSPTAALGAGPLEPIRVPEREPVRVTR